MNHNNITLSSNNLRESLPIPKRNYHLKKYCNGINISDYPKLCQELLDILDKSKNKESSSKEAIKASAAITALNYANYHFDNFPIDNYTIPNADLSLARGQFICKESIKQDINIEGSKVLDHTLLIDPKGKVKVAQPLEGKSSFPKISIEQVQAISSEKILLIGQNKVIIFDIKEKKIDHVILRSMKSYYFCRITKSLFILSTTNLLLCYNLNHFKFQSPYFQNNIEKSFSSIKILSFLPKKNFLLIQTRSNNKNTLMKYHLTKFSSLIPIYKDYQESISCITIPSSEDLFVSGDSDKKLSFWDSQQQERFKTLYGHNSVITALEFTHDETLISASLDSVCKIWKSMTTSPRDYSCIFTFNTCSSPFIQINPLHMSNKILCRHWNGVISIWDIEKQEQLTQKNNFQNCILNVDILPDNDQVLIATRYSISLNDSITLQQQQEIGYVHEDSIKLIISEDKAMIATVQQKIVQIWQANFANFDKVDQFEFQMEVIDIKITQNKQMLFISTGTELYQYKIKGGELPSKVHLPSQNYRQLTLVAVNENKITYYLPRVQIFSIYIFQSRNTLSKSINGAFPLLQWTKQIIAVWQNDESKIQIINSNTLKYKLTISTGKIFPNLVSVNQNGSKLIFTNKNTFYIYDVIKQKLLSRFQTSLIIQNVVWFQNQSKFLVIDSYYCQQYSMSGPQGQLKMIIQKYNQYHSLFNNDSYLLLCNDEGNTIHKLDDKDRPWFKHQFSKVTKKQIEYY